MTERGRSCPHPGGRRGGPRHRLFWKVYLFAVGLLLVAAVSGGVASSLLRSEEPGREMHLRIAAFLDGDLAPMLADRAAVQSRLDAAHRAFEANLAVAVEGEGVIAAAGEAVEVPAAWPDEPEGRWRRHRFSFAVPFAERAALLVGDAPAGRSGGGRFFGVLFAVMAGLALMSLPFARALARPLEQLTRTVNAFGEGALSVRAGIDRPDEVGDLARAFDRMAERIEGLLRAERELLANVSHELRTPLSRIRVALELVEDNDDDSATVKRHIEGIGSDLAELEGLIEDVLAAARLNPAINDGALVLHPQPTTAGAILDAARSRFERRHKAHTLEVSGDDDAALEVDPAMVRRLLDNLLDNAAKYADADSGPIELEAGASPEGTFFEVRDRGIGASAEDLPRLFDPFFRTDKSRAKDSGGVGLGLALCRRIALAHGGNITAKARDGAGLAFRVTFSRTS